MVFIHDLVVRQADKGGAVVTLDKGLYIRENKKMLEDKNTYRLASDPTPSFKIKLEKLVNKGLHLGVLTQRRANYINREHSCIPIYHSLPKLHKAGFSLAFVLLSLGTILPGLIVCCNP